MWGIQGLLILPSSLRLSISLRDRVPEGLITSVSLSESDFFLDLGVLSGAGLASSLVLGRLSDEQKRYWERVTE